MSLPPGKVIEDDPPVPVQGQPASVFSGRLAFTAHDPASVGRLRGVIDAVILKADGGDRADPSWSPQLREAGFRVLVWQAEASQGMRAVDEYDADGYVGQAESQAQLDACLSMQMHPDTPKALVSNVTSFDVWPAGWYCLGESYVNADPAAKPNAIEFEARKRGATGFSPVYGCYDASSEQPGVGRRVPVAEYLAKWPYKDWALYLAETLEDSDVDYLRRAYPA